LKDRGSGETLLRLARDWLSKRLRTDQFVLDYWNTRRCLLSTHPEIFVGRFGELASNLDTALESYSPTPDKGLHEIDEAQLRREIEQVLRIVDLEMGLDTTRQ